jgi:hypothetical protein
MSINPPDSASCEWSDMSAFNPFPLTGVDLSSECLDDPLSPYWVPDVDPPDISPNCQTEVISTMPKPILSRVAYGHGRDAKRTARYRRYPIEKSFIVRRLQTSTNPVTKRALLNLIEAALSSWPECLRPAPPTRTQRRVIGGLVAWADQNASLLMHYSASQNVQK